MAFQDAYLTLERARDAQALTILGNAEFSRDAIGNLTVSWSDPLKSRVPPARLLRADVLPWLSEGVEQQRNRANAFLVITDAGGSLLRVTWGEVDPWTGVLVPEQELWGVATLVTASAAVDQDSLALIVYRADYRYQRTAGLLETRASSPQTPPPPPPVEPEPAQYWRVVFDSHPEEYISLAEVAFADNLSSPSFISDNPSNALGGPGSNGTEGDAYDGDPDTMWESDEASTWIGYDFGTPVLVEQVGLVASEYPAEAPNVWALEFSHDGTTWHRLASGSIPASWSQHQPRIIYGGP